MSFFLRSKRGREVGLDQGFCEEISEKKKPGVSKKPTRSWPVKNVTIFTVFATVVLCVVLVTR